MATQAADPGPTRNISDINGQRQTEKQIYNSDGAPHSPVPMAITLLSDPILTPPRPDHVSHSEHMSLAVVAFLLASVSSDRRALRAARDSRKQVEPVSRYYHYLYLYLHHLHWQHHRQSPVHSHFRPSIFAAAGSCHQNPDQASCYGGWGSEVDSTDMRSASTGISNIALNKQRRNDQGNPEPQLTLEILPSLQTK